MLKNVFSNGFQAACLVLLLWLPAVSTYAKDPSILVSAEQLFDWQKKSETAVVVVDIRENEQFVKGHIEGAVWVNTNVWRAKTFEPNGLTETAYWSEELSKLGVADDRPIVIVGGAIPEAARTRWLLKYLGMSNSRLLDGGFQAWTDASLPVATAGADNARVKTTRPMIRFQDDMLATLQDVSPEAIAATKCRIVDNRSMVEFTGSRGIGARTGHIPNAIHLEWQKFIGEDGKFLPPESIKQVLAEAGVDLNEPLVAHCQTGGRSSVAVFALELVGAKKVKNYYSGWSEYGDAITLPVEKGPE